MMIDVNEIRMLSRHDTDGHVRKGGQMVLNEEKGLTLGHSLQNQVYGMRFHTGSARRVGHRRQMFWPVPEYGGHR